MRNNKYYVEIMDAIARINEVENLNVGISIPNPEYRYLRFKEYPYDTGIYSSEELDDNYDRIQEVIDKRVDSYLADFIDLRIK